MPKVYVFNLPNIFCAACVQPIKNALADYKEIKIVRVSEDIIEKKIAFFVGDDETKSEAEIKQKLLALITDLGIDANYDNSLLKLLIKGLTGVLSGFAIMAFMMSGIMIPSLLMYLLMGASTGLTLYLGSESYKDALKNLIKTKTLSMDSLFSISTLSVLGVSLASLFIPKLPMMLDAALMIFGFRLIGRAIDESLKQHMVAGLKFRNRVSSTVEIVDNKGEIASEKTPINQIKPGNIIVVRRGEVIPVDGECLDESSSVYDTIISGSHLPRTVTCNELLLAGMVVPNHIHSIRIRVKKIEAESFLARLDDKIATANLDKAPIEDTAQKILQYFVPIVLGIAALSGIVVGCLFNPIMAIQCAASVLVSACPCTLGLITPMSIKIGLSKASEHNILFKSGEALQKAEKIDAVVLDLNGTLTTGVAKVCSYKVNTDQGITPLQFFQYLSLLEQQSEHPIAASILDFLQQKNINPPSDKTLTLLGNNHAGINAKINDDQFIVGNAEIMKQNHISLDAYQSLQNEQGDVIYLAKNGVILGYLILKDNLRNDAKETIEGLKRLHKEIYICTGADQSLALYYANLLNIPPENVYGNCTGSDVESNSRSKIQLIKQLQQQGKKVAMIGDATNDSLALSSSDFGIAINSNAADPIPQQEAAAIIPQASLYPIINAFTIAQQTVANIKQNLILSFAYNTAMLLLAGGLFVFMGFVLNPGLGVALMVLQTSLVLLNQYRFRRKTIQDAPSATLSQEKSLESTYQQFNHANLLSADKKTEPTPSPTSKPTTPEPPASPQLAPLHSPEVLASPRYGVM